MGPIWSTTRSAFTLIINDPHVLEKIIDSPDELTWERPSSVAISMSKVI